MREWWDRQRKWTSLRLTNQITELAEKYGSLSISHEHEPCYRMVVRVMEWKWEQRNVRYVGSRCGSGGPLLSLCQELARGYFPTHPPTGDDNQEYCAICVFTASS